MNQTAPFPAKPELLSPAGDRERLEAAVQYGADAVYLGAKQLGMRSAPSNFDWDELKDAVRFAHGKNVRVYLTCNTVPTNEEMDMLPEYLKMAEFCAVDALIVSDIGVMRTAKRVVPNMELHISTQAGVVNYVTARELYEMGAKRVVLARELSLENIRIIRDKTPCDLEIETFVHGAMCVSFSGRCLLSHYIIGRDANRGECAQPCRWGYHLMEEKRPGEYYPVFEDEKGTYILNAKDLCMLEHLDDLARAGVTSFKIEGRAKSAYYVAVVTNCYRLALEEYLKNPRAYSPPDWLVKELGTISHRAYCTGFYYGPVQNGQNLQNGGYIREYEVAAVVTGWENGMLLCTQRNRFFSGSTLELVEPGKKPVAVPVTALYDKEGASIVSANHPLMDLHIPFGRSAVPGSLLRIRKAEQ